MGFGGGGSGSFVLPNHDHTNVLADGGELLEATSLIDGITLKAWVDSKTDAVPVLWELIEDYEAGSAEASHTFTFTALDMDDHSELVLIMDISPTVILNLQCQVNGHVAANYQDIGVSTAQGGLNTVIDNTNQTAATLISSATLGAGNRSAFCETHFGLTKAGTGDNILFSSKSMGLLTIQEVTGHSLDSAKTEISSIKILTSTSTWQTGTRMTLYKVKRA